MDRPVLTPLARLNVSFTDEQLVHIATVAEAAAKEMKPKRMSGSHKWCVKTSEVLVFDLRAQGIACRVVQTPDWHHRDPSPTRTTTFTTRTDGGFRHGDKHDPSHTWVELADGTIIDATIKQFSVKDFPRLPGHPSIAVIRPDDPYMSHYDSRPLPGNEVDCWKTYGHNYTAWANPDQSL